MQFQFVRRRALQASNLRASIRIAIGALRSKYNFSKVHEDSLENPEAFWGRAAEGIAWSTVPKQIIDDSKSPFTRWYIGGRLNTCFNCLDKHVNEGHGGQTALIFDSPVTSIIRKYSFRDLYTEVNKFSAVLMEQGVKKGDRVVIFHNLLSNYSIRPPPDLIYQLKTLLCVGHLYAEHP